MNTRTISGTRRHAVLLLLVALTASGAVFARDRDDNPYDRRGPAHEHVDTRYAHNHPYLDRGYIVRTVPRTGYAIDRGRDHFWFDRGQWYRRSGVSWVVVGAPVGAFVSVLPPFYTTVWFGGLPYYYANDTYYTWSGPSHAYEVVDPPTGIDAAATTQAPASDQVFVYPKNGQSSEQESRDRYECHRYAVQQTGFDPTQSGGGVAPEASAGKRSDYMRAQSACLDARGYSVR